MASLLLHTELHCAANRRPEHIEHESVSEVLSTMVVYDTELRAASRTAGFEALSPGAA